MLDVTGISDTHITAKSVTSNTLFPAYIRRFPESARQEVYDAIRDVVHECHEELLSVLAGFRSTLLLHFGDLCGGWDGRGIGHGGLEWEIMDVVKRYRGVCDDFHVAWGNHDVGYRNWRVDPHSLAACERISPIYWCYEHEEMMFLGVCEPLLRAHEGESAEVTRARERQADFVTDTLRRNKGRRWILCGHSADIGGLEAQASAYLNTMQLYIFGDRHIPWFGVAEKAFGYTMRGFEGACRRKSLMCPSAAPLWWQGGAYMRGAARDGRIELMTRRVEYSPLLKECVRQMPFSSTLRAYRYMMQARMGL